MLLGSSGAGKTTLMNVIAGREDVSSIRDQILLNGHKATKTVRRLLRADRHPHGNCNVLQVHCVQRFPSSKQRCTRELSVDELIDSTYLERMKRPVGSDEPMAILKRCFHTSQSFRASTHFLSARRMRKLPYEPPMRFRGEPTPRVNTMTSPSPISSVSSENSPRNAASTTQAESSRKSAAIAHTKFYRMEENYGDPFEKRMCRYCTSTFSFKGRTTSAALRHLKLNHPEKLAVDTTSNATATERAVHDARSPRGETDTERVEIIATSSIAEDVIDAADDTASLPAANERNSALPFTEATAPGPGFTLKRKRDADNEQLSTALHASSERGGDEVPTLTASQRAIKHFFQHYADVLSQPAMRLRFARHLTHNVPEAEMYNVLDPATQLEFVREFARQPGN